jgi:transposase, IS6 family
VGPVGVVVPEVALQVQPEPGVLGDQVPGEGRTRISPVEVTTDRYRVYPRVLDEVLPAAFHDTEVHANNPLETDHGRLKARLRPMRGLKRDRTARVIVAAHTIVQNLRRGFYDLGTDVPSASRLADAFAELALAI